MNRLGFPSEQDIPHIRKLPLGNGAVKKLYPHVTCKIQQFPPTFLPFSHFPFIHQLMYLSQKYSFRMKIPLSTTDHWTQASCDKSLPCPNICQFGDIRSQSQGPKSQSLTTDSSLWQLLGSVVKKIEVQAKVS